jgi:hypothetical protein
MTLQQFIDNGGCMLSHWSAGWAVMELQKVNRDKVINENYLRNMDMEDIVNIPNAGSVCKREIDSCLRDRGGAMTTKTFTVDRLLDIYADNMSDDGVNWKSWRGELKRRGLSSRTITALEDLDNQPYMRDDGTLTYSTAWEMEVQEMLWKAGWQTVASS